ncbi:hypothetical protein [Solimonas marina]|uniref:Uncharacterized protein n=1 Tax=Solimonas marina TaxID=2714601 RepID=A0A969W644_9GAMM|nr:hypothetical protein [Solimonas marina]NKF21272.1 hypothetical protein [Solimonas marina]
MHNATLPTLLLAIALTACGGGGGADGDNGSITRFTVEQADLTESSGLARSQRADDLYWSHNDSGGPTDVYAFDGAGNTRGVLHLAPTLNLDWEDVSSFSEGGEPYLLVGDIGDNSAIRPSVRFYIVGEPALDDSAATVNAAPTQTTIVRYPDGARDCESIAVDADEGMVYLLSKRDAVPHLYRVPLHPTSLIVSAEALGEINIPRAPADAESPERINWVTSMDFDAERRRAAVVTLTQAYVYTRGDGESWADAFQRAPSAYALPDDPQIEAIAFSADGQELLVTSEGSPTPAAHLALD